MPAWRASRPKSARARVGATIGTGKAIPACPLPGDGIRSRRRARALSTWHRALSTGGRSNARKPDGGPDRPEIPPPPQAVTGSRQPRGTEKPASPGIATRAKTVRQTIRSGGGPTGAGASPARETIAASRTRNAPTRIRRGTVQCPIHLAIRATDGGFAPKPSRPRPADRRETRTRPPHRPRSP